MVRWNRLTVPPSRVNPLSIYEQSRFTCLVLPFLRQHWTA